MVRLYHTCGDIAGRLDALSVHQVRATRAAGLPLVLLMDGDVAMSLGRIIRQEIMPEANVIPSTAWR